MMNDTSFYSAYDDDSRTVSEIDFLMKDSSFLQTLENKPTGEADMASCIR